MVIRGDTNIIKVYDYTSLIDLEEYDLTDSKEIERLNDVVVSFLDAGEAEAVNLNDELIGVIPDTAEIEIEDKVYSAEDIEYINKSVKEIIEENFEEGDILLLVRGNGDGYFEYEENPNIEDMKIGYTACDIDSPDNEFYNNFCDLLLPYLVEVDGEKVEVVANNFYPRDEMVAELYVVREDGGKFLDKVTEIDVMHFGWDLFEDLIQVDYDESI